MASFETKPEVIEALEEGKKFLQFLQENGLKVSQHDMSATIGLDVAKSDLMVKLAKLTEHEKNWVDQQCQKWYEKKQEEEKKKIKFHQ